MSSAYHGLDHMRIRMEYAAHNNMNIGDITEGELAAAVAWIAQDREGNNGRNQGTYAAQIVRGANTLGVLVINIWNSLYLVAPGGFECG